jgi:hypothetical protein
LNAITHELVTVTTDAYINAISVIEILDKLADKYKGQLITVVPRSPFLMAPWQVIHPWW